MAPLTAYRLSSYPANGSGARASGAMEMFFRGLQTFAAQ
jgi:hypothetical protein